MKLSRVVCAIALVLSSGPLAGASQGFFEKAVRSRELKSDPERRGRAWAKIGWCELRLGRPAEARKAFDKANEGAAGPGELALAGTAVAWARLGKPERARTALAELRRRQGAPDLLALAERQVEEALAEPPNGH